MGDFKFKAGTRLCEILHFTVTGFSSTVGSPLKTMYLDDRKLKINKLNEMVLVIWLSLYLKYKVLKINARFCC